MGRIANLFASALLAFSFALPAFAATGTPDAMVKSTVDDVLEVIKKTKDRRTLRQLAEEKVVPKFDFKEMTKLAVGQSWSKATPEQQQELEKGFRSILVNTYTLALSQSGAANPVVEVRPVAGGDQKDVTVKTIVKQSGKPPVPIDYRMSSASGEWKVYDVLVENLSLITTYRGTFSETIGRSGIDGLIKQVQEKNKSLAGA